MEATRDPASVEHFVNGAVATAAIAIPLAWTTSFLAAPVLVLVVLLAAHVGGRDAHLGSMAAATFLFIYADTEPHFQLRIAHTHDVWLLVGLAVFSVVLGEVGVRRHRRALTAR